MAHRYYVGYMCNGAWKIGLGGWFRIFGCAYFFTSCWSGTLTGAARVAMRSAAGLHRTSYGLNAAISSMSSSSLLSAAPPVLPCMGAAADM